MLRKMFLIPPQDILEKKNVLVNKYKKQMSYKQNVLIETSNICFKNFMFLILNLPFLYAMKFRIKRFKDMYIKRYIFSLLSLTMTK